MTAGFSPKRSRDRRQLPRIVVFKTTRPCSYVKLQFVWPALMLVSRVVLQGQAATAKGTQYPLFPAKK